MKNKIIGLLILLAIGFGIFYIINKVMTPSSFSSNSSNDPNSSEENLKNSEAKQYMLDMQPFAESYYDNNGDYEGICAEEETKSNYAKSSQTTKGRVICNDSADGWAVEVQLVGGSYFCMDAESADEYAESSISGSSCVKQ